MTPNTAPTEALPPLPLQGFAYGDDGNPCALSIDQVFVYARAAIASDRIIRAGDAPPNGPRDAPEKDHILFVLYEIGRFARGVKMGRAVHGLCPAGCGCLWRDNFDGTMSLGYNQRSCKTCEPLPFDKLIPLFASVESGRAGDAAADGVWVPREPTLHMLERGHHKIDFDRSDQNTEQMVHPSHFDAETGAGTSIETDMRDAWAAMLAAAPQPTRVDKGKQ